MGDTSATALIVRQVADGDGSSNFLLPDGTFFVVLAIFLIVLAVLSAFVVPPIQKVLRERENMVTKTIADNKQSADQFAAADADYEKEMSAARSEASSVRDDARAEGQKVIEDRRGRADAEVASTLQSAGEQLKQEGDAIAEELRTRVESLSTTLASRIVGVDIADSAAMTTAQGR